MPSITRILDRVIFYGLLATIVLSAIPYGTVQPAWIALFECLVFIFGLLGLLDLLFAKAPLPAGISLAVPVIVLCLFILFQALPLFAGQNEVVPKLRLSISADRFSSLQLAIKLFALLVAGVLLLRYARTETRLRVLVYVVISIAVASALFGLIRQGGQNGPNWLLPLPNPGRGFAQFVNRNDFGFLVEMALGLTLGLLARGSQGYQRFAVLLPITGFLWVALIISNSRGAIFASLCQLLFLVIMLDPLRRLSEASSSARNSFRKVVGGFAFRAILIVSLIAVFAYGVSWVGGETVVSNFELAGYSFTQQGAQGHRENVSRRDIWAATWQLIKARPIMGSGFGGYWIAITKYHNASGTYTPQEAHNDYLELLASGGLIGSALVVWFAVRFMKDARQTLRARDRWVRAAALGAITGIFGVIVHSFVDFGLHVTTNALIFTTLLALAGGGAPTITAEEARISVRQREQFQPAAQPDFATH